MFKSNGNNISIPNNYVYTSNKGTEYMYLDGSWMNCSTLNIVESTHNFKMNRSAIQQINEHNKQNKFQIGKKYIFNESSYVYVGRNSFTVNGNLLSESINSRVKMLIEAEEEPFSNLKLGDKTDTTIPSYFKMGDYVYKKGAWFYKGDRVVKKDDNLEELNNDAKDYIEKINNNPHETLPIGTTVDYKGRKLTFVGDAMVDLETGSELPSSYVDKVKSYAKTVEGDQAQGDAGSSDVAPDSEVPTGYVYTSGKGKKYFKKNGRWYSSDTKQPINQSAAAPLERAAQAAIAKHNQTEQVKIGTEWKSKQGKSYKYVGNGRFISAEGKLLPPDISKKVLNDLSQNAHDHENSVGENTDTETPEVNIGGAGSQEGEQGQSSQQNPQGQDSAPAQSSQNSSDTGSKSGLEGLAEKIKASPHAPRIVVLLSRGDEVSLLAADILLSGKQNDAKQILNSLNNED